MDKEFYGIYRDLVELYRFRHGDRFRPGALWGLGGIAPQRILAIIGEALEEAAREIPEGQALRPDARLFLLVNLHQMVALPLSHPESSVRLSREVEDGIKADARTIVRRAVEYAKDRKEIPASHVLKATSEVLDDLNLKSWRLWERE